MNKKGYKLRKQKNPKEAYFIIKITADSNDADYITEETHLSTEEFEKEGGLKAIQILKKFYSGNHEFSDFCPEIIDVPRTDWGTCHTIEDLSIEYVNCDGIRYDVTVNDLTKEEISEINKKYDEDYIQYLNDLYFNCGGNEEEDEE